MPSSLPSVFEPTAEQTIALLLVQTAARRRALQPRLASVLARAHPKALFAELAAQRLTGIVGPRLKRLDAPLPQTFYAAVDEALERDRATGMVMTLVLDKVVQALDDAGIASLPLKGTILSWDLYGEPGARCPRDIDILVAPSDLAAAARALSELDYVREPRPEGESLPLLHDRFVHRSEPMPPIELHWRIHWYEQAFSAEMLQAAVRGPHGPQATLEHALSSLLLFYVRDGFVGLRLAADIAAWCDAHLADLDEDRFRSIHQRHAGLARALQTGGWLARELVGAPIPLAGLPGARSRAAARLLNWPPDGRHEEMMSGVSLVDGLLSPSGEMASFIRRRIWLERPTMNDFYPKVARTAPGRGALRIWHPIKTLTRYAGVGLRLCGGRSWTPAAPEPEVPSPSS